MGDFFNIAANIKTSDKTIGELKAIGLANRNRDLENRIMQRNEDYFKSTGGSPAKQADRKLDIEEEIAQIDKGRLTIAMGEYGLKANEDQRKALTSMETIAQAAYGAIKRGDPEGAQSLWSTFIKANKLDTNPDLKDSPLLEFNAKNIEALATMAQTKDPKAPFNYIIPNAKGEPEIGSVDRNDLAAITALTGRNALFDNGANGLLSGYASAHPDILKNVDKNPALLKEYVDQEKDFNGAFFTMGRITDTLDQSENSAVALGTSGKFVRMADSIFSQVSGLVQLATDITGNENKQRQKANLPVYGEGTLNANGEFQQRSIVPSENKDLYADTANLIAAKVRSSPFRDAVGDATKFAYNIMDLEYTIAKLEESGSRNLSDTDIKRRAMLFDVGSPEQLRIAVDEAKGGMANRLAFSRRLMDPTGELYSRIYPGGKDDPLKTVTKPKAKTSAGGVPNFNADVMAIIQKAARGDVLTPDEQKQYEDAVAPTRKKN